VEPMKNFGKGSRDLQLAVRLQRFHCRPKRWSVLLNIGCRIQHRNINEEGQEDVPPHEGRLAIGPCVRSLCGPELRRRGVDCGVLQVVLPCFRYVHPLCSGRREKRFTAQATWSSVLSIAWFLHPAKVRGWGFILRGRTKGTTPSLRTTCLKRLSLPTVVS
jgi:hypothetical protein